MAKLCYLCVSFCVYFVIFLRICKVSSSNENLFYQIGSPHHRLDSSLTLELLPEEAKHTLHKRAVIVGTPSDDRGSPTKSNISAVDKGTKPPTSTYYAPSEVAPPTSTPPTYPARPNGKLLKNLGENGAGQRKYYNTTDKPIPPKVVQSKPNFVKQNSTKTNETEAEYNNSDPFSTGEIDVDEEKINKTLAEHNITTSKSDNHNFYHTTLQTNPDIGSQYWVNMSELANAKVNDLLSRSHRRAATIKLSFEFPFYGHLIKNVTIATGGFLYTGDYVHSWLAATQYIAPLMANFDTSLSNDSLVKYVDNGTAFTVEWENVILQDKPKDGNFTFQATLHANGDIVFVYKHVPFFIEEIEDKYHPVKVGVSDAYITDRTKYYVRRKIIYEYHHVNFEKEDIKNWTVIYIKALPTCLDFHDCKSCLNEQLVHFNCTWCPATNRCSTGIDRHRQEWTDKGCNNIRLINESMCSNLDVTEITGGDGTNYVHDSSLYPHLEDQMASRIFNDDVLGPTQPEKVGLSSILAILFLVALVSGLGVWIFYAYRHPHTTSGQILIRYRPSQWGWRRGEARYTAATIHM